MSKEMKNVLLATGLACLSGMLCMMSLPLRATDLPAAVVDADYYDAGTPNPEKVELGRALFFDKILSGNKNISCASCHHPLTYTTDRLSLGAGEGGQFHGAFRTTGLGDSAIRGRIGRNAPALFNLGAKEFVRLNLGGINEQTAAGLRLLSGRFTPSGLDNVLAGQALFPLIIGAEMLGQAGENDVVDAVSSSTQSGQRGASSFPAKWEVLVQRLRDVPEYVSYFQSAFPDVDSAQKMGISHVVNAIAAFQAAEFRSDNSPFDHYLRGDTDALSGAQLRGMDLFYNKANCASCHSGKFQTDQNFHAIAMPQFGPGAQTLGALEQDDTGRQGVTQNTADYYKFRTPSLRNVALTGPYGHTGAYATLEGVIRHHLDPAQAFASWDRSQVRMPSRSDLDAIDFKVVDDPNRSQPIVLANELAPMDLTDEEMGDLVSFLHALTDPDMLDLRRTIPTAVPSGLPVGD